MILVLLFYLAFFLVFNFGLDFCASKVDDIVDRMVGFSQLTLAK